MMSWSDDALSIWQEELAEKLRRGRIQEVKAESRGGVFHVVGSYTNSTGKEIWDSYAYFSKPQMAEDAVRTVKRVAAMN
ncbi:MAG: hypothetical protein N2C14_23695 [Planctomycetales bacterium]